MRLKKASLLFISVVVLSGCKTYEVMHYKANELDKIKDLKNYTVYVHSKNGTFKLSKPAVSSASVAGDATPVSDKTEAEEIKNPSTPHLVKKHKQDLNLFTKIAIKDTTGNLMLRKSDIADVTHVVSHSKVNWKTVGDGIADVLGIAVCIALIGALVYWFSSVPN